MSSVFLSQRNLIILPFDCEQSFEFNTNSIIERLNEICMKVKIFLIINFNLYCNF